MRVNSDCCAIYKSYIYIELRAAYIQIAIFKRKGKPDSLDGKH
jgi:hypothetical protein